MDRIEARAVTGATILAVEPTRDNDCFVQIEYDEGGGGWWPQSTLRPTAPLISSLSDALTAAPSALSGGASSANPSSSPLVGPLLLAALQHPIGSAHHHAQLPAHGPPISKPKPPPHDHA